MTTAIMETRTYAIHNCHRKDHKVRIPSRILLTCLGPRGRKVYNTFVFVNDSMKMSFYCILNQFDDYFELTFLRYNFFCINCRKDNVLTILLSNWKSSDYQKYNSNWYHIKSFKVMSTPRTWLNIRLYFKTLTCIWQI